jgi:hypothetical protein
MRPDREMMKVDATDKIGRLGMCITPGHVQYNTLPVEVTEIDTNEILY